MSGLLGAFDLAAATETILYTVPSGQVATVSVNLCNRGGDSAGVRIALLPDANLPLSGEDYIEYDADLCYNESLERTGIVLSEGQSVAVYSDIADVTAQVYGWEEPA